MIRAPEGFWWCLGATGAWHLLPVAAIPADGPVKGQTACGLWPSLVIDLAWREVRPWLTVDGTPPPLCPRCAGKLHQLRERDRLVTPPATQPPLF